MYKLESDIDMQTNNLNEGNNNLNISDVLKTYNENQDIDSRIIVEVTPDCMYAKIKLKSNKDSNYIFLEEDILYKLKKCGVVYGIKYSHISRLVRNPVYDRFFKVAQGQPSVNGEDAQLKYNFDCNNSLAPKILEDGSVDYKNMGFSNEVKQGDLLCEIVEAEIGNDGYDVLGHILRGKNGKSISLPGGSNTYASPDKLKLYASIEGHVFIKANKINVSSIMVVDKVDSSTGNITFLGDVCVNGDVSDGFCIKAGGNITIRGVAENATLMSGNDIVISKGIKGKESCVTADGSIRTGYIEMAKVSAKGCIYADALLNADIKCEDKLCVTGRKGCIVGGVYRASNGIEAKDIGNSVNIYTELVVISPDTIQLEKKAILEKIEECNSNLKSIKDNLLVINQSSASMLEKRDAVVQALLAKGDLEKEIKSLNVRYEELSVNKEITYKGQIVVHGHMFPNVSINMEGIYLRNNTMRQACSITRKEDGIVFGTYKV